MAKKSKAWSMSENDWQWLESQPNQSRVLREAIRQYREKKEEVDPSVIFLEAL